MLAAADARMLRRDAVACWKAGPLARPVQVVPKGAGPVFWCRGPFTQRRFVQGRSLAEIERILGLQPGALAAGADVYDMPRLPAVDQFEIDQRAAGAPRWH